MRDRRIIAIAGAGIAGMTVALFLERHGFRVIIFEKADGPSSGGAGIQISPNAIKLLDQLDLGRALRSVGTSPESVDIRSGLTGRELTKFVLGRDIRERHGAPYMVLHRVDLSNILLNACIDREDIEIVYGHQVTDLAAHANGLTVLTKTKREYHEHIASAVIGADGVGSILRRFVPDAVAPEFTGRIAWRAILDIETVPDMLPKHSTGLWLGPKAHLVHYPVRQGQMMNVVAVTPITKTEIPPRDWQIEGPGSKRTEAFEEWQPVLQSLMHRRATWGGWPIYAVPKLGKMSNGPLCLIGDAAHAMEPYAAQGGACAIEDAAILADLCGNASTAELDKVFLAYEKLRQKRVRKIIQLGDRNRRIYHMGMPAAMVRNLGMRFVKQVTLQQRMDWLYGWDPELKVPTAKRASGN